MASNASDFPFGIMDVVELLPIRKRRPGANSFYVDCPFCGDGRGKMNVNYVKKVVLLKTSIQEMKKEGH